MKSDARRAEITARAYRDLVASGRYTYANFVAYVLEQALGPEKIAGAIATPGPRRAPYPPLAGLDGPPLLA